MLTLYLYSFSFYTCLRIWDVFLLEGNLFLVKFAIAVITSLESIVLSREFDELNEVFHKLKTKGEKLEKDEVCYLPTIDVLISKALKVQLIEVAKSKVAPI